MKKPLDYEIENVGGIDHVKLRLASGVNVLRGHNAAGKTSAIRAIERAQGGKAPVERRDGTSRGYVRGPGVSLSVRKVAKTTGEAELELADTGPLARLIDPGMKPEAAARARIRALIELLDLQVEDEHLELLTQKDEGLHVWLRQEISEEAVEDLMEVAELLRHKAHSRAREQEADVEQAEGVIGATGKRADDLLEKLGGPDKVVTVPVSEAREKLDEMTRRHERAVAQCEAREALEAKQKAIAETLGERPEYEQIEEELQAIDGTIVSMDSEVEELEAKIRDLRAKREVERANFKAAQERLRIAEDAYSKWKRSKEILEQPVEGPTRDRVAELKERFVDDAQMVFDLAQQSAEYHAEEERRAQAVRERDEAAKLAEHYRELAANIPEKLGEILGSAGAPGLTVVDGRLHAITESGSKDFEDRCSTGERVSLALGVAATAYQDKVLPLDGLLWASLDPEHKAAFAQLAEELGLYVITEEPADGPLRIEREES